MALSSKLMNTCLSLARSAWTTVEPATCTKCCSLLPHRPRKSSMTSRISSLTGKSLLINSSRSLSSRESSRSSSTIFVSRSISPVIRRKKSSATSRSSMAPRRRFSTIMASAVSGVRSSWDTLATKSRRISTARYTSVKSCSVIRMRPDTSGTTAARITPAPVPLSDTRRFIAMRSLRACLRRAARSGYLSNNVSRVPTAAAVRKPSMASAAAFSSSMFS